MVFDAQTGEPGGGDNRREKNAGISGRENCPEGIRRRGGNVRGASPG